MGSSFGKLFRVVLILAGLAIAGWLLMALFVGKERSRRAQEAQQSFEVMNEPVEAAQQEPVEVLADEPQRTFDRIVAEPAPTMQEPEPIRVPKLVIPMSEISFERSGETGVRGRDANGGFKDYAFATRAAADAGVAIADKEAERSRALIPGCWFRDEAGVPDHLQATLATKEPLSGTLTCKAPGLAGGSGNAVSVTCSDGSPVTLTMVDSTEAADLRLMLQQAKEVPGRTWLRKEAGRPLVFQLLLDGSQDLSQTYCKSASDGRDCCADRPWPNTGP